MIQVTCFDITGHTRQELTSLCARATARAAGPMSDDQRKAARLLLAAFASFVEERVSVPTDIRMAVADLLSRGDDLSDCEAAPQDPLGEPRMAA